MKSFIGTDGQFLAGAGEMILRGPGMGLGLEVFVMTRQAILNRLNAEAPGLRKKYGVKSLAVFGSIARGDDHEGSDVDVLVEFEGLATFRGFMGLKLDLEDMFGRRVDLGTPDTLRPEIRSNVEKDLIHVT
jgi:uncharacterized protein